MIDIPEYYASEYTVQLHNDSVTVGTRDSTDIISWLLQNTSAKDFVVLKFDVDDGIDGLTMEWGFLSDLFQSKAISLIDELFIELHFLHGKIGWRHEHHSMTQAHDIMQQMRTCGIPVHAWP